MKNIKFVFSTAFVFILLLSISTIYAQDNRPAIAQQENRTMNAQSELTPEQRKALKVKRIKKTRAAKAKNAANQKTNGDVKKSTAKKGVPMTGGEVAKRKNNISKAKTIATINKATGRVKAGEAKLAAAKAKLATVMANGNYTDEGIKEKKRAIAAYEEFLLRLKKSIEIGNKQLKN